MLKSIGYFFTQGHWKKWVVPAVMICTLLTCLQQISISNYNNINIFRYSSFHLRAHQPLYILYPAAYFDYYLYHPSFAVLFIPFSLLPPALALCTWTFLSVLVFLKAVNMLPGIDDTAKKIILLLVLPELLNNQQYVQTNIFLSALLLLAFIYFEKGKPAWAAFFTILAFCIKGYGGIIGLLFLLYPGKGKFIGYAVCWGILINALPLLFVSYHETVTYYADWLKMISSDEIKESMSFIGVFGKTHFAELSITAAGLILLAISFFLPIYFRGIHPPFYFRGMLCCYLFIWALDCNRILSTDLIVGNKCN